MPAQADPAEAAPLLWVLLRSFPRGERKNDTQPAPLFTAERSHPREPQAGQDAQGAGRDQ